MFNFNEEPNPKERKSDRVLVVRPIPGKKQTSETGLTNTRIFTEGTNLHAIMNQRSCLWGFKLDNGILAGGLKQQFTSFSKLKEHADSYFKRRGMEIVEVID